jgi:hypothetical protein
LLISVFLEMYEMNSLTHHVWKGGEKMREALSSENGASGEANVGGQKRRHLSLTLASQLDFALNPKI